ncbi:hypothetical protein GE061_004023 [Apolygus lucorum]|uniref:Carboxypeptidase n=1 Tax=Apolygus lucorum TaxID=248454 RepID=A0A8S9WXH1_APOLU|nr:hypothetical protein GE061_004023 [Apolygus lucorum]
MGFRFVLILFLCARSYESQIEYAEDDSTNSTYESYYGDFPDNEENDFFVSNEITKEYVEPNVSPVRTQRFNEIIADLIHPNVQEHLSSEQSAGVEDFLRGRLSKVHNFPTYHEEIMKAKQLLLTPYINGERITEGRRAAIVPDLFDQGIISYSGFVTNYGQNYTNNMFFWYIPAVRGRLRDEEVPVILWLQGGLNVALSSIPGNQLEDGENKAFSAWSRKYHMIFMDPVGLGFSFTDKSHPITNGLVMAEEYCSALRQFFQLFSELSENEFFIAGQTNMGKYVPSIALSIHQHNVKSDRKINLKGVMIGNGRVDPQYMVYGSYLAEHGLIDTSELPKILQEDENYVRAVKDGNWGFVEKYDRVEKIMAHLTKKGISPYDYEASWNSGRLQMGEIRKLQGLLHGGSMEFKSYSYDVLKDLRGDIDWYKPVGNIVEELLNHKYRILYYNGALHPVYHHSMTQRFADDLDWEAKNEYRTAERRTWWVKPNFMGGLVKSGGSLSVALIHGVADRIFKDQPVAAANLLTKFIHNEPLQYLSAKPLPSA